MIQNALDAELPIVSFEFYNACNGVLVKRFFLHVNSTRTPPVEVHRPVVTYLQFPIQVCFSILSVCRPRPASHANFRHRHIPELICGFNSSIDYH